MWALPLLFATSVLAVDWPSVQLQRVAAGLNGPVSITHAGDASGRLFVAEQSGRVRIIREGLLHPAPFLDISGRVNCCGERGLLGLAFPPEYKRKGHFYVFYTNAPGDLLLSRFRTSSGDPDRAESDSESVLLTINHREFENHNGGHIAFGPDGYLYIGPGDGGGGGDTLGSGQNLASLLGKLLRIDVEAASAPYAIPETNPFANRGGARPEIWAYGLRNPWRFSFDRETGDLFIGDVGQERWEEINFQPASSKGGENYGWNVREALHCYEAVTCADEGFTAPVAEYDHQTGGCSVTGGYVYRGPRLPSLRGFYFYADYCNGRLWGLARDGGTWRNSLLLETGMNISTFGEDEEGNLYLAAHDRGELHMLSAESVVLP